MSTPDPPNLNTVKKKSSPFCGSINKNLLTPCRQVGLSRKRKTPNNFAKSFSEDLNCSSNSSINSISYLDKEITPKTRTKPVGRSRKDEEVSSLQAQFTPVLQSHSDLKNKPQTDIEKLQLKCIRNSNKKESFSTFTSEDLFESNIDFPLVENEFIKDDEKTPLCIKNNSEQASPEIFTFGIKCLNDDLVAQRSPNFVDSNRMKLKSKSAVKKLSSDFIKFEDKCFEDRKSISENHIVGEDSDDDFVIKKRKSSSIKDNSKLIKKTLSSAKSSFSIDDSCVADNLSENSCIKRCKIQLQQLNVDEMQSLKSKVACISTSGKTLINKSNSSNLDETDDFFTSTPEEERIKKKNIGKEIQFLENQIKEKQLIFENLERASIYKSKHDIQELKRLSSLWLDGCVQALKDLLKQLQAHGPMDLTTILNNMRIPKEIIVKLSLEND